jgi:hypothetical protein
MILVHAIKTVAIMSVAACVAFAIYCGVNGIRSMDDFRNYRTMRSIPDPIVVALADGTLGLGSTTQQMLAIDSPSWTEDYGRCKIYGFTPERSYDHQTIVTVDNRIVSARVGSCTWRWSFFDETPDEIAESVAYARGLHNTIEQMPKYAAILQPLLDERLASLGVATDNKAEPSIGIGARLPGTPPTPPYMRVRIRRLSTSFKSTRCRDDSSHWILARAQASDRHTATRLKTDVVRANNNTYLLVPFGPSTTAEVEYHALC